MSQWTKNTILWIQYGGEKPCFIRTQADYFGKESKVALWSVSYASLVGTVLFQIPHCPPQFWVIFVPLFHCLNQKHYTQCKDCMEFYAPASLRQDESEVQSWTLHLHTEKMNTLYGLTRIKGKIHFESETGYCPNAGLGRRHCDMM